MTQRERCGRDSGARLCGHPDEARARALLITPKLLILDAVTSALGPAPEAEIRTNVRMLDGAMTIVSHRPASVDMADRLCEIDRAGSGW